MVDVAWLDDLDPFGRDTTSEEQVLTQDVYHVIEQDKGSNLSDPTRGLGVANMLSGQIPSNFATTAAQELAQDDDRIDHVEADIETVDTPPTTQGSMSVAVFTNDDVMQQLDVTVPFGTSSKPPGSPT